jgi:hypothetical protein
MSLTNKDVLFAAALALLLIAIVACATLRVRAADIDGYWASTDGEMYEVRADSSRGFTMLTSGKLEILAKGTLRGLRGIQVNGRRGTVNLGGRRIAWPGHGLWSRQGV